MSWIRRLRHRTARTAIPFFLLGAIPAFAQSLGPAANGPSLDALVEQLGDETFERRDDATRRLIALGSGIVTHLRARLLEADDLEIRYRLRYILENITPPPLAVLVVRAEADADLDPGDLITHVGSRRVRSAGELRLKLSAAGPQGAMLRVVGAAGPREVGPLTLLSLSDFRDYVAPRGETLARVLRLYAGGYAEQAYSLLRELPDPLPEEEMSRMLQARLAYVAGDSPRAFDLLKQLDDPTRAPAPEHYAWSSPSWLDLSGPGKAPFHLEWALFTSSGRIDSREDPDLRVQRVLVPAGRFMDALLRSTELWWTTYRDKIAADPVIAGNQLAVTAWMLHDLGLRSECCRLIEPRSEILRQSERGRRKWVRVDTDAWLPLLAGDEKAALDSFYDDAMDVLQQPPRPGETNALIRNPLVAARLAYFLYQAPDDRRVDDALLLISHPQHPALQEYVRWMLLALSDRNFDRVREHLQTILPRIPDAEAFETARAVALLEYAREKPEFETIEAARQRIFQTPAGATRDRWLALLDAQLHLLAGRPADALKDLAPLEEDPLSDALRETARFMSQPPSSAANHAALANPVLAVPAGSGRQWLILARDRRLMLFDEAQSLLTAVPRPLGSWLPHPLTWPWIGREAATGRVWVYSPRRVLEVTPDAAAPLRLNIRTEDIEPFARYLSPHFSRLAEAVTLVPVASGENGEFLRADVKAHADLVSDPDLPELAVIQALPADPRVLHVALRGGPHVLVDTSSGRSWSSFWLQEKLDLPTPPSFFAQAFERTASAGQEAAAQPEAPGRLMLMSDQGLIRFDLASEQVARVPLPGDEPFPALVPESAPYERRDPLYVYCARLPADGGGVYRYIVDDGRIEPLGMVNEALPPRYFDLWLRSRIRAELDKRLTAGGMLALEPFIEDAAKIVAGWDKAEQDNP